LWQTTHTHGAPIDGRDELLAAISTCVQITHLTLHADFPRSIIANDEQWINVYPNAHRMCLHEYNIIARALNSDDIMMHTHFVNRLKGVAKLRVSFTIVCLAAY
jgi:hypothetical protein